MQKLVDKLLLLGLCSLAMSLTQIQWASVVVSLVAVASSSLNSYLENRYSPYFSVAYVATCFIAPGFTLFLPLVAYDCAGMGVWALRFCWCVALLPCFAMGGWRIAAAVALSSAVAFLMQCRTSAALETKDAINALADDAKEKAESLERKHRELMEKQDYEVRLVTLAERNRIAREIHDNVGHLLTRSILQLGALRVTCGGGGGSDGDGGGGGGGESSGGESSGGGSSGSSGGSSGGGSGEGARLDDELELLKGTLSDAMDSIRSSVHDLHDESVNLKMQLEAMIDGFKFCPVRLRYDAGELPVKLRLCFAAVVREALSNIARHSDAAEAAIAVVEHPALCQLVIWDNGTAKSGVAGKGIGLQNMADRIGALGGVFRVERGNGFKVFISVPKEGELAHDQDHCH